MNDVTTASLLFAAVGLLYIAPGVPLFRGQVKPNSWYGCRTTKTLSDEKIWYVVNRVTGRDMIAAGIAVFGFGEPTRDRWIRTAFSSAPNKTSQPNSTYDTVEHCGIHRLPTGASHRTISTCRGSPGTRR